MPRWTRSDPSASSCAAARPARGSPPRAPAPHGIPRRSAARRAVSRTSHAPAAHACPSHRAAQKRMGRSAGAFTKNDPSCSTARCAQCHRIARRIQRLEPHARRQPLSCALAGDAAHPAPADSHNSSRAAPTDAAWAARAATRDRINEIAILRIKTVLHGGQRTAASHTGKLA